VLGSLDDQGLVVRAADPQDARGVLITVSEAGQARLDEVRTRRTALIARRLERLDDDQREAIRAALPAIEALLEE
jgi:DNA-binding MarR family transcriptional regulator